MDIYFDDIKHHFAKWQRHPNVEIEFRIGKKGVDYFDTNVGEVFWTRIWNNLNSYDGWESTNHHKYEYIYTTEGARIVGDTAIVKRLLYKQDFYLPRATKWDFRMAISEEKPIPYPKEYKRKFSREKETWSFVRKNLTIDMSKVRGGCDLDVEDEYLWEIELEIIEPQKIKQWDELYNIVHKILCILK